jgi:hypothetical protein
MNWNNSVIEVSVYGRDRVRSPAGAGILHLVTAPRPALERTHPPKQWVPGTLSPELKRWSVQLTTRLHFHPVQRLRMRGALPSVLPHTFSWLYLNFIWHSSSWECDSHLAGQEISRLSCDPKALYRVHKSRNWNLSWAYQCSPHPLTVCL